MVEADRNKENFVERNAGGTIERESKLAMEAATLAGRLPRETGDKKSAVLASASASK